MNERDKEIISREELKPGIMIERVINGADIPYTAITINTHEVASMPTELEGPMIERFKGEDGDLKRFACGLEHNMTVAVRARDELLAVAKKYKDLDLLGTLFTLIGEKIIAHELDI